MDANVDVHLNAYIHSDAAAELHADPDGDEYTGADFELYADANANVYLDTDCGQDRNPYRNRYPDKDGNTNQNADPDPSLRGVRGFDLW